MMMEAKAAASLGKPDVTRLPRATRPVDPVCSKAPGAAAIARLSSRVYLPAVAWTAVAAVLVAYGWSTGFGGVGFARALSSLHAIEVGAPSLVILVAIVVAERIRPAQRRPLVARGHRHDAVLTVFTVVVVAPFVTALGLSFTELARQVAPWMVLPHSTGPRWLATAVIVVGMDACNWLAHSANHHVRPLWRFHELHHSQEDMNVFTVFRTHPLVHVSYLVALMPALVLVRSGAVSRGALVAYATVTAFAHSNTNVGFGPLERVLVSPNFHRVHHRLEGPQDVNLGFVLTVWDQLARRAVFPTAGSVGAPTGLPGRPLCVEQQGDRPQHLRVLAVQLTAPFRPMPPHVRGRTARTDEGSAR